MTPGDLLLHSFAFEGRLRAVVYRHTRTTSDVDDILQETRIRLYKLAPDKVSEIRDGFAFVSGVATNAALDWQRRRKILPIEMAGDLREVETEDEGARVENRVNATQELRLVLDAARGLPPQCRDVFLLRKLYGYSRREIAEKLQIAENTVHEQYARGLRRFESLLSNSLPREQSSLLQRWRASRGRGRGKP